VRLKNDKITEATNKRAGIDHLTKLSLIFTALNFVSEELSKASKLGNSRHAAKIKRRKL